MDKKADVKTSYRHMSYGNKFITKLSASKQFIGKLTGSKLSDSAQAIQKLAIQKLAIQKLANLPGGKVAGILGLLGASTGLAFTQLAPTQLQAVLIPRQAKAEAPLRQLGDPTAEAILSSDHLFLTHEILYRKIEALARIPQAASTTVGQTTATQPPSKQAAAPASKQPSAAQRQEPVIAAAPPAPKAAPVAFTGTTIDSVLEMRVAVAKDVSAIAFATSNGGVITDLDGNPLKTLPAETSSLAEINNAITVDGHPMPSAFWVYPENGGYVAIGDSWYRGRMLIALRERGLIAVNYVLLGDYLYSVVGSEMSASWPLEALKAQAVAARSYALTHNIHPASENYFDLDNTQRFQAYKGIAREANTTQAAVQATAGEFISHEGGIVESLYAASQDIVDDAHNGSGMSQFGARDLAAQGYAYSEILGHYYPGTALGRIETAPE
ncbi:MAG: SpoIID/LytB domain-containing protein [Phormidesmis sp. RL_2_1]|nr:SpoIID/LytB domain-containing protein [Phormidesmis sp. RL_2_1]